MLIRKRDIAVPKKIKGEYYHRRSWPSNLYCQRKILEMNIRLSLRQRGLYLQGKLLRLKIL